MLLSRKETFNAGKKTKSATLCKSIGCVLTANSLTDGHMCIRFHSFRIYFSFVHIDDPMPAFWLRLIRQQTKRILEFNGAWLAVPPFARCLITGKAQKAICTEPRTEEDVLPIKADKILRPARSHLLDRAPAESDRALSSVADMLQFESFGMNPRLSRSLGVLHSWFYDHIVDSGVGRPCIRSRSGERL